MEVVFRPSGAPLGLIEFLSIHGLRRGLDSYAAMRREIAVISQRDGEILLTHSLKPPIKLGVVTADKNNGVA